VNLLYFTAPLLPSGSRKTGNLALAPDQSDGGRHRSWNRILNCLQVRLF
jgi:hypothetical protein